MDYNFGSISTNVNGKRLNAWDIYNVKFDGCRIEQVAKKDDPTQIFNMLKTRFQNENGYFEETTFFPENAVDAERRTYTNPTDSKVTIFPSRIETAEYYIAQLLSTLSPEAFEKLKKVSPQLKTFEDIAKVVVKLTDPLKGTDVVIKVVGRVGSNGSVNATFPNFVSISKTPNANGVFQAYMSDRFIKLASDTVITLAFSDYELKKKKESEKAKPTNMTDPDHTKVDTNVLQEGDPLDLNSLGL